MEDYAAKMQLKTDAELRQYVTTYAQYRDEAVLAALAELRRRGQPDPEEATLRPLLEEAIRLQPAPAAAAPERPTAAPAEATPPAEADPNAPTLYTPGVIVLFSVLFNNIIMSAILLALNFYRLRRPRAIWGLAAFVLGYLVAESFVFQYLIKQYGIGSVNLLIGVLNLPAILAYLLWFWPRYVGTSQFRSRGWLVPLVICFVAAAALNVLVLYILKQTPGGASLLPKP